MLDRRKLLALALVAMALTVFPLYVLHGLQALVGVEVQPRYLLPLMLMFGGIALFGFNRDDLGLNRFQGVAVVLGVSFANSYALHTNMRRYITGLDDGNLNLNDAKEWWWSMPIEPMTVWFVGSVSFGLFLFGTYIFISSQGGRNVPSQESNGLRNALIEPPVQR